MSRKRLINWVNNLLFGSSADTYIEVPPDALQISIKLETKGINVKQTIRNGGLLNLTFHISEDLDHLVEYLDHDTHGDPIFKTRVITMFYNKLSTIAGKNLKNIKTHQKPLEISKPCDYQSDQKILDSILKNTESDNLKFKNADFWGQIAKRLLEYHRPPGELTPLTTPIPMLRDVQRLYDITCKTLGRIVDPFSMVLISREDYLDPIYWQSSDLFEKFLKTSNHSLVSIIKVFLEKCILNVEAHMVPDTWKLHMFLKNVLKVHQHVQTVDGPGVPPKLVDVFHRLLTLADKDEIWDLMNNVPKLTEEHNASHLLLLHERILLLKKENQLLSSILASTSRKA